MAIKGLPGWEWHYIRDAHGKQIDRWATDPAGNRYTQRDIQSLQHGEVYEKRVPKEQRKIYKRKVGKWTRHGPFHSLQEIKDYQKIGKDKSVFTQAKGKISSRARKKSPQKSRSVRSVGAATTMDDLQTAVDMIEHGFHDTTPAVAAYTTRLQENIQGFTEINEYFLYER